VFTWPVVLSLCVSGLAFVVSLAALAWQVVSWRRSGPRVTVRARSAVAAVGGGLIVIEANNSGRLGTETHGCGFDLPNNRQIVCLYDFFGQPFQYPAQLSTGGSLDFHLSPRDVPEPLLKEHVTGDGTRAFVQTGHGRFQSGPFHLGDMIKALGSASRPREM
jgi:hypothetical protein